MTRSSLRGRAIGFPTRALPETLAEENGMF